MRLGELLATSLTSPREMMRLPGRLFRLVRDIRCAQSWRRLILSLECGLPDDPLRRMTPPPAIAKKQVGLLQESARTESSKRPVDIAAFSPGPLQDAARQLNELDGILRNGPQWPEKGKAPNSSDGTVMMALHAGEPDLVNGYTRRSQEILKALKNLGWDIEAAIRPHHLDTDEEVEGIVYRRIPCINADAPGLVAYGDAYGAALEAHAQKNPVCLVHAASNHVTGFAAAQAARKLNLPFIYEVRGLWEVTRSSVEPSYPEFVGYAAQQRMELEVAQKADRLLVNGEQLGEYFVAKGIAEKRVTVAPNGCDPDGFAAAARLAPALRQKWRLQDRATIGFVGSLTPYEGLDQLLNACRRLPTHSYQVLFVGDGPYKTHLEKLANERGLDDQVYFVGRVSPDEAKAAYSLIDIAPFLRPDTPVARLTPPLKPLDAMAGHCAILTSKAPPLAAMAANDRGFVVDLADPGALSKTLAFLVNDAIARKKSATRAFEWVSTNRRWRHTAEIIGQAYSQLL